jgi:putative phosphoribosyl transferase
VDPLVLALPRGGVPIGAEVAQALGATLEVFVSRKVGAPGQPEFGIGAVAEGGAAVATDRALDALGLSGDDFAALADRARAELDRRVRAYRGDREIPDLSGRDVVLVDDGLATGVTAEAALRALRARDPGRLVLAAPVCAPSTARRLRGLADDVVCVLMPEHFSAVGQWYDDFGQLSDADVLMLL